MAPPKRLALNEKQLRRVSFPKLPVAVSLPDTPDRAYVWEFQDEDDVFVRDHRRGDREYQALRRFSLDSWTPVCEHYRRSAPCRNTWSTLDTGLRVM